MTWLWVSLASMAGFAAGCAFMAWLETLAEDELEFWGEEPDGGA